MDARSSLTPCRTATSTLGLLDPWEVRNVRLDVEGGDVRMMVAAKSGTSLWCPECDKSCPGYDSRERSWRHLDTCQFRTILVADVPRVKCSENGVRQVKR